MKKYLLLAAAILAGSTINAQVAGYRFMHESGAFLELDNYPGAVITNHNVEDDNLTPAKVKITFPFRFGGQLMDSVGVHENGFLFFGSMNPVFMEGTWPISTHYPAQVTGIVSALGVDLHPVDLPAQKTTIKSAIAGTAPARIFIAEWKGTTRIDALNHPAGPDNITFQIRLYESSNRIELTYGQFQLNPNITDDVEIGIKGATYNDYSNRVPGPANWSASVAGTSQSARKTLSSGSKPDFGTLFVWEPGDAPTSITEHHAAVSFYLYPVPVNDVLRFRWNDTNADKGNVSFMVTDMSGKIMLSGKTLKDAISVNQVSPGTYLLVLENSKGKSSKIFSKS